MASSLLSSLAVDRPVLAWPIVILGSLSLFRLLHKTLVAFLQTTIVPGKSLTKYGAKKGAWAVVTGASDGIGREFALQLADAGFNVMLIARNELMLDSVEKEIHAANGDKVSTQVKIMDFSVHDPAMYEKLKAECAGLDVGVLVNNVGRGHAMPVEFATSPLDEMDSIIDINIKATLHVTHAVLPSMVNRKRGLVLNVGSFAGSTPCALLSTYSASKAFLSTFSGALAQEVKPYNIDVQLLNTYFVVSKLSKIRRSSLFIPEPRPYVRSVLSKIGLAGGATGTGRPSTLTPYWSHALMDWAIHLTDIKGIEMRFNYNLQKDIRRRALKRQEREKTS